jgi:hypothetical protein
VHALDLFDQVDQARVEHRALYGDDELVGGVCTVAAEDPDLADVDAETAEQGRDLAERAGPVR